MNRANLCAVTLLAVSRAVVAFAPLRSVPAIAATNADAANLVSRTPLFMGSEPTDEASSSTVVDDTADQIDTTDQIEMPITFEEMTKDTARAMTDAYERGITRQTIRVLLPRDPMSDQLGQYFENDADVDTQNLVLAPADETWQGGIMQLYRAAAPTCQDILRRFSRDTAGVPPRMVEDRSVDASGVDGVGLWMSQSQSAKDDVSCFVQPTQESINSVENISKQAGERLVVLMNPQWRMVDDALDVASKSGGVFGSVASFLGGKGVSLQRLDDMGFTNVFTLEGYVCRGGNIRMVKRFDSQWTVFAENDSATDYIKVGTSITRPSYQDVDAMLSDKGIALKYARDVGLAPKL